MQPVVWHLPNDDIPNDDIPNDDIPNDDIPNDWWWHVLRMMSKDTYSVTTSLKLKYWWGYFVPLGFLVCITITQDQATEVKEIKCFTGAYVRLVPRA
jgi:hypothetical protein